MKPKKFISAMSAILIILLVLTSCGKSPDNKSKEAQSVETGNESSLSTTEEKM